MSRRRQTVWTETPVSSALCFKEKVCRSRGDNVKCQPAGPAVVAGEERIGFREPFAAVWAEVAAFAKKQDYLFSQ